MVAALLTGAVIIIGTIACTAPNLPPVQPPPGFPLTATASSAPLAQTSTAAPAQSTAATSPASIQPPITVRH